MNLTTRLSLSLLAAIVLALTFYAYPSLAGFLTLFVRAAAILGVLAVVVLIGAAFLRRRPARLDIIIAITGVGVIIASVGQISATADANRLAGEIADAGEERALRVIAATGTRSGELIRSAIGIRDATNGTIEAWLLDLWDDDLAALFSSDRVEDEAAVAATLEQVNMLLAQIEGKRVEIGIALDAERDDFIALDNPLPDSARLTFIAEALDEIERDRIYFENRLELIVTQLGSIRGGAVIAQTNQSVLRYDPATEMVVFDVAEDQLADQFLMHLETLEATYSAEAELVAAHDARRNAAVLILVDAVGTTP